MSTDKFVRDRLTSAIDLSQKTMEIAVMVRDQTEFDQYTAALRGRKGNKLVEIKIGKIPEYCKT